MKRIFKKTWCIALALALLITSVPLSGFLGIDFLLPSAWAKTQKDVVYLNDKAVDYSVGLKQTDLRMPMLSSRASSEPEPGKLVEVDEYSKTYQTGKRSYKTVYSEIPK